MVNLTNICLFCDSGENLNTTMTVKVSDIDYVVAICEEHEDLATPKAVREKAEGKAQEIEDLKKMAAKLGLKVGSQEPEPDLQPQQPHESTAVNDASDRRVLHKGLKSQTIDKAAKPAPSQPATAIAEDFGTNLPVDPSIGVSRQQSYNPSNTKGSNLHTTQTTKQVVQASDGRPIHLPKTVRDNEGGQTNIRVVNTGGDVALQRRFKQLGHSSTGDTPSPHFGKGYTVRDCVACGGTGAARIGNGECPKCSGDGFNKI